MSRRIPKSSESFAPVRSLESSLLIVFRIVPRSRALSPTNGCFTVLLPNAPSFHTGHAASHMENVRSIFPAAASYNEPKQKGNKN